jgi:nicotinamide mononucleotide transporter
MTPIQLIEWAAVVLGFCCVALNAAENIWGWPAGLLSVFLYLFVFFEAKLYADVTLHVIYVGLSAYGWYHWLKGGQAENSLPITRLSRREWMLMLGLSTLGAILAGLGYDHLTGADLPYLDSVIMAFSLAAQYMLARKQLENWIFWIGVDIIAIGVYYYKGLYPTAMLYAAYLVLAAIGYVYWRRQWKTATVHQHA